MKQLIFATTNAHKATEVRAILAGTGIQLQTLLDHSDLPEAPETGDTFQANALEKARFIYELTGTPTIADDSGIEITALGNAPGVRSKRFSPEGTDQANNALMLRQLSGKADRSARYRCVLAIVCAEGERHAEGVCEGRISETPRGKGGFGYDPYFLPDDRPGQMMAELSMSEKNAISHRGRAFRQLPALLKTLVQPK